MCLAATDAAAAVEIDNTLTRTKTLNRSAQYLDILCWTCFQSCVSQSKLWCLRQL